MVQSKNALLFEIPFIEKMEQNPKMLRVIVSKEFTRIDFGYTTPWYYDKGGWINIYPNSYLELQGFEQKFQLIDAIGVPLAPNQNEFQSTEDWQFFSLLFEAIPFKDCVMNMIEAIEPTENNFNFYAIELKMENGIEIL